MSSEHPGQRWVLKPVYHKLTGNDKEVMYPPPPPFTTKHSFAPD